MAQERKLTVRISEDEHRAARVKAAELGRPVSEIVRGLLTLWVQGKVSLPELGAEESDQD